MIWSYIIYVYANLLVFMGALLIDLSMYKRQWDAMQQPEGLWTMNAKQEALLKLRCYISERVLVFEKNKLMSRIAVI